MIGQQAIRLFWSGPTVCLIVLTEPRNIFYVQAGLGHRILPKKYNYFMVHESTE